MNSGIGVQETSSSGLQFDTFVTCSRCTTQKSCKELSISFDRHDILYIDIQYLALGNGNHSQREQVIVLFCFRLPFVSG